MKNCAQITAASFWAPALETPDAWEAWARTGLLPASLESSVDTTTTTETEAKAAAKSVPPMLRRRLSPLGRAVAEATGPFAEAMKDPDTALVFASRWGDAQSAVDELRSLVDTGTLSPTLFATSVHNGIAAILSIAHGHRGFETAVAAGPFSLEAGFMSAVGLLEEHPRVVLCAYDARSPEAFDEKDSFTHASAFLLEAQIESEDRKTFLNAWERGPFLSLMAAPGGTQTPDERLETRSAMADLDVIRWLLADDTPFLTRTDRHADWIWAKNARLTVAG